MVSILSNREKLALEEAKFLQWLEATNYAVRTREGYKKSIEWFLDWVDKETSATTFVSFRQKSVSKKNKKDKVG